MKILSAQQLANTVQQLRVEKKLTVQQLSALTTADINRIERADFIPTALQFDALSAALGFDITNVSVEKPVDTVNNFTEQHFKMMIALRQQIILRKKHERKSL
jgi:transcriptional regulator with XRE-family HTH domain